MSNDQYAGFEESTLDVFSFLSEYGFEHTKTTIHNPEYNIKFQNTTTLVSLTHEMGGPVWILVAHLKEDGERDSPLYHLGKLIIRLNPNRKRFIEPFYAPLMRTRRSVRKNLEAYATFLKNEGEGILRGDFSICKPEDKLVRHM